MSIIAQHITVSAGNQPYRRKILDDVSCCFDQGNITLVVGRTGSGKSTLLDALTGLVKVDQGQVFYNDQTLWDNNRLNESISFQTGLVFQSPEQQLFARTVQGEFEYSLRPYRLPKQVQAQRTISALGELNLPVDLLPRSPFVLSGGQKRRVALATTLATQPAWLFLDEPTAGLDPAAVQDLIRFLHRFKEKTSGGIVIATHDFDTFFPIADRVIVMHSGHVLGCQSPLELSDSPDILLQAGVGLPSSVQISLAMQQHGITLPSFAATPDEMASAIAKQVVSRSPTPSDSGPSAEFESSAVRLPLESANPVVELNTRVPFVHRLDPRTKWIVYSLLSIGFLLQPSWFGILLSASITIAIVLVSRVSIHSLLKMVKPFLFFIFLSLLLSGIHLSFDVNRHTFTVLDFAWTDALFTCRQLCRILLVMVLGMLLPLTTTQLQMKRGLEKGLSFLSRARLPIEVFSLALSLILRFIPLILKELERFARIVQARGKSLTKPGSLRLRDVHVVTIPLLLSVFQLAEDLSLAMEARGYKHTGILRTSAVNLRMTRRDAMVICAAGLLFAALAILH